MTEQTEDQKIREAMSLLGRRTSERKAAASRINMAHASTFRVPNKPCNCGAVPHRSTCPVYNREAQQKHRANLADRVERVLKPCSCRTVLHHHTCPVYNRESTKRSRARQSAV